MTTEAMENLSDLDFDLIQMTDEELDAFAMASAEAAEHDVEEVPTLVAFEAPRTDDVAAHLSEIPERAAA